jgi:hypothetical protein
VLKGGLDDHCPSSETFGLLAASTGSLAEGARRRGIRAGGYLDNAIDACRRGFETDWRDAYPGMSAVTLMELREPGGSEQRDILPVVRYANRRPIAAGAPDYRNHATQLELAVIGRDQVDAFAGARAALAAVREGWEAASTANNLSLIREARAKHNDALDWADELEAELQKAAAEHG